jgi:hypothetical protein
LGKKNENRFSKTLLDIVGSISFIAATRFYLHRICDEGALFCAVCLRV